MTKNIFTGLAVAGMGAALAVGANAQTFGPTNTTGTGGIYTLAVLEDTSANLGTALAPVYDYQYEVTLTSDPSGVDVTQFNISNIQGFDGGVTYKNGFNTAEFLANPLTYTAPDFSEVGSPSTFNGVTSLSFQAATTGLTTAVNTIPSNPPFDFTSPTGPETTGFGDTVVFGFLSTLPPTATVSLGSNGVNGSGTLSGTGNSQGPGPASVTVPETSSFALLGLGLLPLALVARRRLAQGN